MASTRKARIFLIGPAPPFRGGISDHNTELYRHLQVISDITLLSYRRQYPMFLYPGESDRDLDEEPLGDVRYELDSMNPWTWFKAGLEARRYDALVLPWWTQFFAPHYFFLALLLMGSDTRLVVFCHNVVDHDAGRMARLMARLVLRRSRRFIVQTREEKKRLQAVLKKDALIEIVPHPPVRRFGESGLTRGEARRELGLREDAIVILFFGLIRPYKGLDILLNAFARIASDHPNAHLLVAGEPWNPEGSIEARTEELGIRDQATLMLRFLSDQEVKQCLVASDFAVFPYLDGTGSAALQAVLGANLPVIASRLETFREVEEEGIGLLVTPGDADVLARSLEHFLIEDNRAPFRNRISKALDSNQGWVRLAEAVKRLSLAPDRDGAGAPPRADGAQLP